MKKITSCLFLLVSLTAPAFASQVNFSISTDHTAVTPGERVTVVATLVTPKAVRGVPAVAPDDAFDLLNVNTSQSQSTNIQVINGKVEHTRTLVYRYIYTIAPRVAGAFTFPALTVNIDGADYSTQPLRFNVSGGGGEPVRSSDITASLSVSKRALYPGEQAVLTLKIAQKVNTPIQTQRGYMPAIEQIEKAFAQGFSLNRLFTNQVAQGQERINDELYNTFTLQFAVFGLTAGEYSIPGITFEYDEIRATQRRQVNPFFSDFFDMGFFGGGHEAVRRTVRTAPFKMTVRPLPPGAPAGFSGSVGRFTINAAADPQSVSAGEALTLRVTLRGNTRQSNIGEPRMPELRGSDVFTPERQTSVDTGANGFSTRRTYRYLIVPKEEGELVIPPITYPFLDAESGAYRTARTDTLRVTVTPGRGETREQTRRLTQDEIQQVGRDIRYIKTPQKIAHQPPRPYRAPHWYLLFPMPFLIFLFALIYKLNSKRSDESQLKSIRQRALATAVRELNRASKGGTDSEFLGKAATVIEKYISHKFAFPATGRTLEELKDELLKLQIDEKTVTGLTVLIEGINEYRFGGKAFNTQSRSGIINKTMMFLGTMEKSAQKGKPAVASTMQIVILTALSSAVLTLPATAAAPPDDPYADFYTSAAADADTTSKAGAGADSRANVNAWFRTANRFYSQNAYDSAQFYYNRIIDAGVRNGDVHFNLGNTYYRMMKPGLARLHYEKAAALNPNDPDIRANISFITSIIVDRTEDAQGEPDFLTTVVYSIHTLLPLRTQLTVLCALLFALAIVCSAMLMKRGLKRLLLAYCAVLCALLITVIGTSAGYKIYAIESKRYAIILTETSDAKNQPGGTQTLFTAHEGTKLRVSQTVGEWSLVSLPNGASGWVMTASLGKI